MNTWTSTPMTDSPSHFAARYSWLVNKDVPVTPYGWNDVDEDYYPDAALTQTCSDRNTLLGYNECSEIHGPFNKYYFNIDALKKVIPLYKEDNKLLPGNATYNMQLDLWAMGSNWQYDNDAKIVVMGNGEILFDEVVSNGHYCIDPYTAYSKPFWRYSTQWFKCYVKLNINFFHFT